jgi:4-hydroxy-3-polyprenylbenzoate decarboxylase
MRIVVAVTGASGSIYARQVLEGLLVAGRRGCGIAESEGNRATHELASREEEDVCQLGPRGSAIVPVAAINTSSIERIGLIVSRRGEEVAAWEGVAFPDDGRIERFSNDDMFASPASGSARWDAMVVVPASMGCVGRIASGVSSDLISRAADVTLKEGRTLIVVPRETPLNLIHLRNLTALAEAGAVVMPASPSFYFRPEGVEALCATVADRILSRLGIEHGSREWGSVSV